MNALLPLVVAVPLLAGAAVTAVSHFLPRSVDDVVGILGAAASTALAAALLVETQGGDRLQWFGGWQPRGGIAIGISFYVGPLQAGLATLVCGLATVALVYSWRYFDESGALFLVLTLMFTGAMCGFVLSGDVFNMFVFFELMGVAAYALTAYRVDELAPLQGALNFAITNSVGAFMILVGIALVYARTGALNLAQIATALAHRHADGLVIVAFTLLAVGFLVKAAIVPFHFWLADAYAVAPSPVCVLLSGAMCELGLYGVARIYWPAFAQPLAPHASAVRDVLLAFAVVTLVVGAVMAFIQRHLKRMLAYVTISGLGLVLVGVALLDARALGGAAGLVLSEGLLRGALFLAAGVLLQRLDSTDELQLRGAGRTFPLLGVLWLLATVGLVGVPLVGSFSGHELVDEAARSRGFGWLPPLVLAATAVTAAALLRAGGRVFLGWGAPDDPLLTPQPPEREPEPKETPLALMLTATAVLVAAGLVVSVVPGLEHRLVDAGHRFQDVHGYVAHALHRRSLTAEPHRPFDVPAPTLSATLYGVGAAAGAVLLAAWALRRRRPGTGTLRSPVALLRELHTGAVGDYVMWIAVGAAVMGGIWTLTLR